MIGLGWSLWSSVRTAPADAAATQTAAGQLAGERSWCPMTQYAAPDARPATAPPRRPGVRRRTGWWVPASLLGLAVIPVLGGAGRMVELLGGPEVLPTDARFASSPVPLVVHIVAAVVYALLGAFQFSARLRRRGWHRRAGRLLVPLGLAVALSGLWMTLFYAQKEGTGDLSTCSGCSPAPGWPSASSSGWWPSGAGRSPGTAPG